MSKNSHISSDILFIAGGGHSGSTLLDMIIGSCPEVFGVGEIAFYSHYKNKASFDCKRHPVGPICTCGKDMDECEFWREIFKDDEPSTLEELNTAENIKLLLNIINPFEKLVAFKVQKGNNSALFARICSVAYKYKNDLKFILDSSKNPFRLYELVKDENIDNGSITVIHLIRDGRAYINSYQSKKRKGLGFPIKSSCTYFIQWVITNILTRIIINKFNLNYISLSYDQFAIEPAKHLKKLNEFLEIAIDTEGFIDEMRSTTYHNMGGNTLRFDKPESIEHDQSWKRNLSRPKQAVFSILAFPFNKMWVYKK